MMRTLFLSALFAALAAPAASGPGRAVVLVELFTSEGCSSCPPADRLLETLDPSAIVLSEHVDYWNSLGWRDPYSSHANTLRQEAYARRLGTQGPYTPEMVIDGAVEFVGSDARRAAEEIGQSARRPKTAVRLSREGGALKIETDAAGHAADVMLALADEAGSSQVAAGENRGRQLRHIAILRSLRKVGTVKRGATFARTVDLGDDAAGKRIVVFLQDSDLGRVAGAGLLVP